MSNVRRSLVALLAVLPLVAGCGSDPASGPAGASVAPASAELFLAVDTSFDSAQWKTAGKLLDKFPDGGKAIDFLLRELGDHGIDFGRDVKPALGPETDVVGLDLTGAGEFVGLTQPADQQKLKELLSKSDQPVFTREVDGWTAFADSQAVLDRFQKARAAGTLAGSSDYTEAMSEVDVESLVRLYVNGPAVQDSIPAKENLPPGALEILFPGGKVPSFALALKAEDGGLRVEGAAKLAGDKGGLVSEPFKAELPNEVPGDALVYLDFNDLGSSLSALREFLAQVMPNSERDIARVEHELGISLEQDVFPLFSGESALYVRRGFLVPEVTLVTHDEDERAAVGTMDKLVRALREYVPDVPAPHATEIDGVQATEVPLSGPFSLYYAAFDGHLLVTTSSDGIAALRSHDERLADNADFRQALEAAGVPGETTGFAYVDLKEGIRYLLGAAEAAGGQVPPQARGNLEPLQHLVLYGTKDGRTLRFAGFLAID